MALVVDDAVWEELIERTGGAAATCYQCGTCTAACPWGLVRGEPLSVRALIRRAQVGLPQRDESLWLCTACGQCEITCPREVPIAEVFRALRALAWERREVLAGLPSVLWSVYWNDNPWSQPPSYRFAWARGLDLAEYDPAEHEFLLFIGCTASYDRRAQRIARALVRLLRAAGTPFGVLQEEPCCGEAVLSLGHRAYFEEIAGQTAERLAEKGVRRLVTVSPHAFDTFHNRYPALGGEVQVEHYTQVLARLVREGRLTFEAEVPERIAFHDPCYLARRNREVDAPRTVLAAIAGVELVEMAHHGSDTLCCGGGGGRMWMETPAGERLADLRVREALEVGAQIIATACPFCLSCLEDGVKAARADGVRVMEVAEIAAKALAE